jgi:hypothetical protein
VIAIPIRAGQWNELASGASCQPSRGLVFSPAMRRSFLRLTSAALSAIALACAHAAEPVRHIGIHVQPYYEAAREPGGRPRVAVGASVSDLLSSDKREDIVNVRDMIAAKPDVVTPMTMMVLAIRSYDVGMRDEAVFWFYAAKDRYRTLAEVVDISGSGLAQVEDAVRSFATLAGPVINGYAFCDLEKQRAARAKAIAWVERNPYAVVFMQRLSANPGDRRDNLARAIRTIQAEANKERAYLDDPKNRERFYAERKKNDMEAKFCW